MEDIATPTQSTPLVPLPGSAPPTPGQVMPLAQPQSFASAEVNEAGANLEKLHLIEQ
jgi:hypothetical protein